MEKTNNKEVLIFCYAWGKNKDGELSLGHTKAVNKSRTVKGLKNMMVKQICSGGSHSALVTEEGLLMVTGSALHGKLGIDDINVTCISKFRIVPAMIQQKVKMVACGDYHTLCLLENGKAIKLSKGRIYTWGGTLHKKLGKNTGGKPGLIQSLEQKNIIYVGCGDFHSAALTDNGELYTWGGGGKFLNRGQLGHGLVEDMVNPQQVRALKGKFVTQISCGGYHMMAVTDAHELYAWGSGTFGEGGYGEFVDSPVPRKVNINFNQKGIFNVDDNFWKQNPSKVPKVAEIVCGGHHSLIRSNYGHVYSCGYALQGQLGLKLTINQCEPQLIYSITNKRVIKIAAGWNHSMILTEKLDVFSCGYGASGQLGLGDNESKTVFTPILDFAGKNVSKIFAGGNHSWAVIDYNHPLNEYYVPPSPLRSPIGTPIVSRDHTPQSKILRNKSPLRSSPLNNQIQVQELLIQNENNDKLTYPSQQKSVYQSKQEELQDAKEQIYNQPLTLKEKVLHLQFTDIDMCHRFVRIMVKEKKIEEIKEQIDDYIKNQYELEQGLLYHILKKDQDITEENSKKFTHVNVANIKGYVSYTLMMICNVQKNQKPVYKNSKGNPNMYPIAFEETAIGPSTYLKQQEIINDDYQKNLGSWALNFMDQFKEHPDFDGIKYFELRPLTLK